MNGVVEHTHHRGGLSWLGFVLLALCTLGAVLWANIWKGELRVKEVRVEGNWTVRTEDILAAAAIPRNEKLFEVDLFSAQRRVSQTHFLRSVTVTRELPARIVISVVERVPLSAVALDELLYIDTEGYVLPAVRSENVFDLPVLTGNLPRDELVPGRHISSDAMREAVTLLTLAQRVDEQLYWRISEVHVDGKNDLIFYTSDAGVPVIVGHDNIGLKLVKFDSFWKQMVDRRGAQELQYIDLRFQDQVIVKWTSKKGGRDRIGDAT
jgi:cell division protein FtsQ